MKRTSFEDANESGITLIEYTCGSDYSGNSVTLSNYQVLKKRLARYKGIYDLFGWYYGYGIGYNPAELTRKGKQKIEDIISSLDNYPLLDDEHLSELELELVYQYVEDMHPDNKELQSALIDEFLQGRGYIDTGCIVYIENEEEISAKF